MGVTLNSRVQEIRHASPAGCFRISFLIPQPRLAPLVYEIWTHEGHTSYQRERILPQGDVVLLFSLGTEHGVAASDHSNCVTPYSTAWISGVQQRFLVVESRRGSHLIGVRLKPLGAYRLLGLPLSELTDQVVDLDCVLGPQILEWRERLLACLGDVERLQLFEQFLMQCLQRPVHWHPAVEAAAKELHRQEGRLRLGDLCRDLGLSPRYLNQRFTEQLGLSPKRYARLLKFRRALTSLGQEAASDLAQLAVDCGYYDQSHFCHEFRRYTGASPTAYLESLGPDRGAIPLD